MVIPETRLPWLVFGDGSELDNLPAGTETDPLWSSNQSLYYTSSVIDGFSYYNSSDFDIADYLTSATILGFNYYNNSLFPYTHLTNFTDDLGDRGYTSNLNFTNDADYYNSTNFPYTSNLNFTNDADYYNSTNPPSDVWVNVSGDTMTGNLAMSNQNVTNISYSTFCNGVNCWKMYVNASDYFIIEEI